MSSLTNTPYNVKSMNGTIVIADGNGTIIQNGNVRTNDINSGSHTSETIYCDNIIRSVNPSTSTIYTNGLSGSNIDIGNTDTGLNIYSETVIDNSLFVNGSFNNPAFNDLIDRCQFIDSSISPNATTISSQLNADYITSDTITLLTIVSDDIDGLIEIGQVGDLTHFKGDVEIDGSLTYGSDLYLTNLYVSNTYTTNILAYGGTTINLGNTGIGVLNIKSITVNIDGTINNTGFTALQTKTQHLTATGSSSTFASSTSLNADQFNATEIDCSTINCRYLIPISPISYLIDIGSAIGGSTSIISPNCFINGTLQSGAITCPAINITGGITNTSFNAIEDATVFLSTTTGPNNTEINSNATVQGNCIATGQLKGASVNADDAVILNTLTITNAPKFHAYCNANQSMTAGTFTKLNFNVIVFNVASAYSTANNRFTPAIAGYYQINAGVQLGSSTNLVIVLRKNGTEYCRGTQATYQGEYNVNCIVYLDGSTDYAEIFSISATANTTNCGLSSYQYFQGIYISS